MKNALIACAVFSIISLTAGCKKSESSINPGDQQVVNSADYMPVSSGKSFKAKVTGSSTTYDSTGSMISSEGFNDQIFSAMIGNQTQFENKNVFPVLGYDDKRKEYVAAGYLLNNAGELIGLNNILNDPDVILMPKQITPGQPWKISHPVSGMPPFTIKMVEALNSYTNSEGRTYSNVINLSITYSDSTSSSDPFSFRLTQETFSANLFLAKGTGIIELKLSDIGISKYTYSSGGAHHGYYYKSVLSGTGTIID